MLTSIFYVYNTNKRIHYKKLGLHRHFINIILSVINVAISLSDIYFTFNTDIANFSVKNFRTFILMSLDDLRFYVRLFLKCDIKIFKFKLIS